MSCTKSQEFLANANATIVEQVDARKTKCGEKETLELVRSMDHVWAARGKKVVHFNLAKEKPAREELLKALLGPSGSLRAPAIQRGKKLFVGFHEDVYQEHLT